MKTKLKLLLTFSIGASCAASVIKLTNTKVSSKVSLAEGEFDITEETITVDVDNIKQFSSSENPASTVLEYSSMTSAAYVAPYEISVGSNNTSCSAAKGVTTPFTNSDFSAIFIPFEVNYYVPGFTYSYFANLGVQVLVMNESETERPLIYGELYHFDYIVDEETYDSLQEEHPTAFNIDPMSSESLDDYCEERFYSTPFGEERAIVAQEFTVTSDEMWNGQQDPRQESDKFGLFVYCLKGTEDNSHEIIINVTSSSEKTNQGFPVVNETKNAAYTDFSDAMRSLDSGVTNKIVLNADVTGNANCSGRDVDLDLNGHTLTVNQSLSFFNGTVHIKNGTIIFNPDHPSYKLIDGRNYSLYLDSDVILDTTGVENKVIIWCDTLLYLTCTVKFNANDGQEIIAGGDIYMNSDTKFISDDEFDTAPISFDSESNIYLKGEPVGFDKLDFTYPDIALHLYWDETSEERYEGDTLTVIFGNYAPVSRYDCVFGANSIDDVVFEGTDSKTYIEYDEDEHIIRFVPNDGKLTYASNSGDGATQVETIEYFSKTNVISCPFTYEYHTFVGWCASPTGKSKIYYVGDEYTLYSDTTLYAQWTQTDGDIVNYFVDIKLHMKDIDTDNTDGTGKCLGKDGYYATAKSYFLNTMTQDQRNLFCESTDEVVISAKERLATWANFNGEVFDVTNQSFTPISSNTVIANSDRASIMVGITIILSSSLVMGFYFVSRRRKKNY